MYHHFQLTMDIGNTLGLIMSEWQTSNWALVSCFWDSLSFDSKVLFLERGPPLFWPISDEAWTPRSASAGGQGPRAEWAKKFTVSGMLKGWVQVLAPQSGDVGGTPCLSFSSLKNQNSRWHCLLTPQTGCENPSEARHVKPWKPQMPV